MIYLMLRHNVLLLEKDLNRNIDTSLVIYFIYLEAKIVKIKIKSVHIRKYPSCVRFCSLSEYLYVL